MPGQLEAQELLLIEEADAWFEYLEAIREQTEIRYKEIEPWAWARLTQRLRAIRTRKEKLRPAAAARTPLSNTLLLGIGQRCARPRA